MPTMLPGPVDDLLRASDDAAREQAWTAFLAEYNELILHVARSLGGGHDVVMDRYAFALEQLGRDDHRRLRGYRADGRGKFTTWLVVVLRRLFLDEHRRRYGRQRGDGESAAEHRGDRRQLADLVSAEIDIDQLEGEAGANPEAMLRRAELRASLEEALRGLHPRDRLLLRFRYEDDLSVPEAARLLGYPTPFHGYRRLRRVLSELRACLRAAGIEDPTP